MQALIPLIIFIGIPLYLIMEHGEIVIIALLLIASFVITAILYSIHKENTAYKPKQLNEELYKIDQMSGIDFEYYVASLLRRLGYTNVTVTKASGDYGADVLAKYMGVTYAFQCKRYAKNVGLKPIQEIYAAKQHYHCNRAVVVTNMRFSKNAQKLAEETDVELWDREVLSDKINSIIEIVN